MTTKESEFAELMASVSECTLCCKKGQGISNKKLLKNFIAERPNGPKYGGAPNLWTDWASRLDAKIVVIGQDWGPEEEINNRRQDYEEEVRKYGNSEEIWRQKSVPLTYDRSTPRMVDYFKESAKLEGFPYLPSNFIDDIYLTNAILCARRGNANSGSETIDVKQSSANCSDFLHQQLKIVKPLIVVTLGRWPLWSMVRGSLTTIDFNKSLTSIINSIHSSTDGYININNFNERLAVIPVFHAAARPKDRSRERQIDDYRYIWRALSDRFKCHGKELKNKCFPSLQNQYSF